MRFSHIFYLAAAVCAAPTSTENNIVKKGLLSGPAGLVGDIVSGANQAIQGVTGAASGAVPGLKGVAGTVNNAGDTVEGVIDQGLDLVGNIV
ncbi:hypothetical protein NLG97_g6725 [Lecanicillium saksenae]|uniref:Uncharacterized protein n=1 Tax=Lecanicillium saksenae TaxID=468837 RepID=A0ACC1QNU0_9HYPO|nr:hypothetical protein NLG97_g6725 [Lecanicillium saksenae]